ncbi:phosphotransferase [Massilia sp. Root351]|nr:phosphotransferase [Massilia sp. Root351]
MQLVDPAGNTVRQWRGAATTQRGASGARDGEGTVTLPCCAARRPQRQGAAPALPDGVYQLRLRAEAGSGRAREVIRQRWEVMVGHPAPLAMRQFAPLPTARAARSAAGLQPAAGELPYTVYYGNLHSQTSHSDGGGAIEHCSGAQAPQSAPFGPEDAYDYARRHGLDFLMTSEHNHMYDGSEGTDASADPARATGLYRSGLAAANAYSAAHPDFLAVYGLEWGVISGGGHLNILNSQELLGWERNAGGDLLADTATAKGDYGALYTLMRERGWLGQFNHPKQNQFRAGGKPLGYTEDGDAAMALCEVMNTNAFSVNTTETETRRSTYEETCQRLLEAGYHVAFATNQDNHCANWGMSAPNRTAILIPQASALSSTAFLEAIRARRVFATMDKQAQIILTANGRLMGERFSNSGPLTLEVRHASAGGKQVAALAIIEGEPGRRNSAAPLPGASASTTITPTPGEHFYYARITQDDGAVLWSAPVWVSQQPAPP